jgi:3-isopropylmalate/(R)-2-methylmalate dehydratase small subunit
VITPDGRTLVVAESFGADIFSQLLAIALPVMSCKGVADLFQEGDRLQLDFERALVKNLTTGKELKGPALSPDLIKIVQAGASWPC